MPCARLLSPSLACGGPCAPARAGPGRGLKLSDSLKAGMQVPCGPLPGEALRTSRLLNLRVFFVCRMVSVGINGTALKLTKW